MKYLTRNMSLNALSSMKTFERELGNVHDIYGIPFREDLGRRNALLSRAQEEFFAQEIGKHHEVTVNGKTGEPDIIISSLNRELECKLTSGHSGSWALQTDYSTLSKKGSLDYLYVLADSEFKSFAVLYFEDLTPDQFHPPSPGAREKARMNKSLAMEMCEVLVGTVSLRNDLMIDKYHEKSRDVIQSIIMRDSDISKKILDTTAPKRLQQLSSMRDREIERGLRKLQRIEDKMSYWTKSKPQYTIELELI